MANVNYIRVKGCRYAVDRDGMVTTPEGAPVDGIDALRVKSALHRRARRQSLDAVRRSLGLVRVKGALGGTYWE